MIWIYIYIYISLIKKPTVKLENVSISCLIARTDPRTAPNRRQAFIGISYQLLSVIVRCIPRNIFHQNVNHNFWKCIPQNVLENAVCKTGTMLLKPIGLRMLSGESERMCLRYFRSLLSWLSSQNCATICSSMRARTTVIVLSSLKHSYARSTTWKAT